MSDSTIPLTTGEWEEWGNPNDKRFHDYMLSYSPIDQAMMSVGDTSSILSGSPNGPGKLYPNVLILAGLNDPRVAYWEPAKWAQWLRRAQEQAIGNLDGFSGAVTKAGKKPAWKLGGDILLKTDLEVGHFSASDRYKYLWETSFEQCFVMWKLGMV
eukprot:gnl/MRDRNA2_/MRDRNA2_196947_c0_seq1.p1 gnl/MRDRNA2_/MRDRNA2_196947_c0~~gnl/MRDRNA2_/MRDRNA2_196947_c0_seq1.p1  ORF type:complete len:181 (+),score=21.27 gnl/MRDRNA2_/MRDRNA2_196947_c0_seq1:76-543(+)